MRVLRRLADEVERAEGERLDALLLRLPLDEKHEHSFDGLREVARIATPKRRGLTGEAGEPLGASVGLEAWRSMVAATRARFDAGNDDKPSAVH